jgi:hypothetical protein
MIWFSYVRTVKMNYISSPKLIHICGRTGPKLDFPSEVEKRDRVIRQKKQGLPLETGPLLSANYEFAPDI